MNAVETIQAAIEALEGVRQVDAGKGWRVAPALVGSVSLVDSDALPVAKQMSVTDARTVLMLHGTIDAQLGILRLGLRIALVLPAIFGVGDGLGEIDRAVLALAKSILRES